MNKILAAGLIAAVATVAQAETECGNGGFYMGATLGASFNKVTAKFDKDSLTAKLEAQAKALAEKLKAAQTAAETAYAKVDSSKIITALESVFNEVCQNINVGRLSAGAAPKTDKAEAASLAAYYAAGAHKDDILYKVIGFLAKYDSTLLTNTAMTKAMTGAVNTMFKDVLITAMNNVIKQGALEKLSEIIGTGDNAKPILLANAANAVADSVAVDTTGYISTDGTKGAYADIKATYIPYQTALTNVTATVDALKKAAKADDASAASDVVSLFYSDVKTKTAETALGANEIADQLVKYPAGKVEKEMTELKANASGVASKKATGFLFGANFGFDHRINDIMLGIELEAGMEAGGKAKFRDDSKTNGLTARRQFYVSLMPRIGYLFAPQFEGFLTFGGSLGKYKVDTSLWNTVFDKTSAEFTSMVNSYNENHSDKIDATVNGTDAAKVYKSHSKTKFVPVIGAGIRYEITPEIFATLAYNFTFKTTIADTKTAGSQFKFQSHILKAGVGFRF